jgi:hypothetical protein
MPQLTEPDEAFAETYRAFVARALDRFEFFGTDPRGITRRHTFDAGYVPLTLNRHGVDDGAIASVGARADQALAAYPRALIRGVAGSGKSTLLRWLGVAAAHNAERGGRSTIPFILDLGRYTGGRLPDLDAIVAESLRPAMPDGWVHRMLADGRVLLLLDGVDEVPARERQDVEAWVEERLSVHPRIRCLVTTRPSVVAEQWWVDLGFERFDLLSMSRYTIDRYVHGWHSVARADYPPGSPGPDASREELNRCEHELLATLPNRPALRGLSANPLLCGLLCTLHVERGEHLPEARKDVYDAALDLLLVRWPERRRRRRLVVGRDGRPSPAESEKELELKLRPAELLKLFQRLAFWMVINRQLVLAPEAAAERVRSCMAGLLHGDEDPERVLQYVAQGSGLLRELPDGSLQFVHRTFRDHLAAREVVEESNLTLMLDNADKPHWHDVVVMAGAHARPAERGWIVRELVARGEADPAHRDTLYLLAAAMLEQSIVLTPEDERSPGVRELVNAAIAELIPPKTADTADQLAAAGPFVLELLPGPDELAPEQHALVVRAAARIAARWNPPGSVDKLLQFTGPRAATGVYRQLLEPWGRLGDYEAYARDVLSELPFGGLTLDLQSGQRIEHVPHVQTITSLVVRNDVLHLTPLGDLPRLRRLTLRGNTMTNLAGLAHSESLRVLRLEGCSARAASRPIDLAPLAGLGLRKLVISGLRSQVDLASLAGVRLVALALDRGALRHSTLPPDLHVEHLCLTSVPDRVDFSELRELHTLAIDWTPSAAERAALDRLPALRRLVVLSGSG